MQEPGELYGVEETSKCLNFLRLLWRFCRCIVSHITLVSMVVAYCVLGAYAFRNLEADHEIEVKKSIAKVRANVTKSIWVFTEDLDVLEQDNWTSTIIIKLIDFEKELVRKMKKEGWDGNEDPNNLQWTFAGALFYSIIVITTIGYGHIAPKTQNGKVVTIFYAIVGIPLMLLCLSNIGDVMASSFRFLYWKICCYVCTRPPKPRRSRHSNVQARSQSLRQPGRYASSNRSSAGVSPFRRSIRASQRSADSVLQTFSENVMRPSHSDTDCSRTRHSPFETGTTVDDGNLRLETLPLPSRYRSANTAGVNEPAVQSPRYSDGPVASPRTLLKPSPRHPAAATTTRSLDRKCLVATNDAERTPVLCNRYASDDPATDREHSLPPPSRIRESTSATLKPGDYGESCDAEFYGEEVSARPWSTMPRRCRSVEAAASATDYGDRFNSLHLQPVRSARVHAARRTRANSRPYRREAPSARIMSPMGFAVHRQVYVDDEFDYDYWASNAGDEQDATVKPVPIWLCVFLVVSYIFGGAFLFAEWETWPFLDSAYFCFITLTTIGFGDLVPAHRLNAHQGIALCSLYLLFGIALLAMSFNLVQEEVINNVKNVAKRLGILKEDYDGEDDEDDEYQTEDDNDIYLPEREERARYSVAEYGRSPYGPESPSLGPNCAAPMYDRFNSYRSERSPYHQQPERSAFRFASR